MDTERLFYIFNFCFIFKNSPVSGACASVKGARAAERSLRDWQR